VFREFEADAAGSLYNARSTSNSFGFTAKVAVLYGCGGHFCAGADLKTISQVGHPRALQLNRSMDKDGPMGITRMKLSKPVIAAVAGTCL
jgi:enoyl-CoA hydratase/carnithine racemase